MTTLNKRRWFRRLLSCISPNGYGITKGGNKLTPKLHITSRPRMQEEDFHMIRLGDKNLTRKRNAADPSNSRFTYTRSARVPALVSPSASSFHQVSRRRETHLIQQNILSNLAILVRNRIMQRVCPNISPEAVEAHLSARRTASSYFEYASGDPKRSVSRHHLGAGHPLRSLTSLPLSDTSLLAMLLVHRRNFSSSTIGQCLSCSEMSEEVAVAFENVEFLGWRLLIVTAIWPGTSRIVCVFCSKVQGAECDAKVEVRED